MNHRLNFLLRTVLSATVEDRETFIKKFSHLLEEYTGMKPERGEETGEHVLKGLTALRDELQFESLRSDKTAKNRNASSGKTAETSAASAATSDKEDILQAIRQLQEQINTLKDSLRA